MRPIKLTMSAFGPYAQKTIIDFDKFGTDGIYLISGDTGSGKSFIFDAIAYALFGDTTGDARSVNSLRSDFAGPETKTYVELEFEYKNKKYIIKRNPFYLRPKLRGEGITENIASAELKEENKKTITGINNVNSEIENILGITKTQFLQIVMIAQGEFRELLQASTNDRIKIFSKLFGTQPYAEFQNNLKGSANELKRSAKDAQVQIVEHAKGAEIEDLALTVELEGILEAKDIDARRILEIVAMQNDADAQTQELLETKLNKVSSEITDKAKLQEKARQVLSMEKELGEARINLQKEQVEESKAQDKLESAKELRPQIDELAKQITLINNVLPRYHKAAEIKLELESLEKDYKKTDAEAQIEDKKADRFTKEIASAEAFIEENRDVFAAIEKNKAQKENVARQKKDICAGIVLLEELEEKEKLMSVCSRQVDKAKEHLDGLNETKSGLSETKNSLKNLIAQLQESLKQFSNVEADLVDIKQKISHVEDLQKALDELMHKSAKSQKIKDEKETQYQEIQEAYNTSKLAYDEAFDRYIKGQVGRLAQNLEDGVSCPVCGSIHHPHPATLMHDTPTEDMVEELEKKRDSKAESLKEISNETSKAQQSFNDISSQIKMFVEENGSLENLNEKKESYLKVKEEVDKKVTLRNNTEAKVESVQQQIKENDSAIENNAAQIESASNTFYQKQKELASLKAASDQQRSQIQENLDKASLVLRREEQTRAIEALDGELTRLSGLRDKVEELQNSLSDLKEKHTAACNMRDEKIKSLQEISNKNASKKAALEEISKDLVYSTEHEAQQMCESLKKEKTDLEKQIEDAQQKYTSVKESVVAINSNIDGLTKKLASEKHYDLDQINAEYKVLEAKRDEIAKEKDSVKERYVVNTNIYTNIDKKINQTKEIWDKYKNISMIADCASGNLSGKEKVSFETYLLGMYLDRVLFAANERLRVMSKKRYQLTRARSASNKSSMSGLDLDVIDNNTLKTRDASSLSGGEAFMASLALALGLSDVVQNHSGGIELDCMFIDEGFGTLDRQSLRLAIKTLQDLSGDNKLIGIISHVEELGDSIDRQLRVTSHPTGSKVEMKL